MKHYKALITVTSHSQLGLSGRTTGFQLAEVTHTLFEFERVGIHVDIMSVAGGLAKIDENSRDMSDPINRDYLERKTFQHKISNTRAPANVQISDYAAVILAGGYGALWDFAQNRELAEIVRQIYEAGGWVGAISQGAVLLPQVILQDGTPLVKNKKVTAMTEGEMMVTGLADVLPCVPEADLRSQGAQFIAKDNWHKNLVVDGRLITGQNTASAQAVGEAIRRNLLKNKALVESSSRPL